MKNVSHQRCRAFGLLLCAAVTLTRTTKSQAADYFWDNPTGGSFTDPANWHLPGGPPGANDTANFHLGSPTRYTVTGVSGQSRTLWIHNDLLELDIPAGLTYELLASGNVLGSDVSLIVGVGASDTSDILFSGGGRWPSK